MKFANKLVYISKGFYLRVYDKEYLGLTISDPEINGVIFLYFWCWNKWVICLLL